MFLFHLKSSFRSRDFKFFRNFSLPNPRVQQLAYVAYVCTTNFEWHTHNFGHAYVNMRGTRFPRGGHTNRSPYLIRGHKGQNSEVLYSQYNTLEIATILGV